VVVSPQALVEEMDELEAAGVRGVVARLLISEACPLILPYHAALDRAREAARGAEKIGTTGRGIGPAYEDKAARRAIRLQDLFKPVRFADKLRELINGVCPEGEIEQRDIDQELAFFLLGHAAADADLWIRIFSL
jgi:adenylosuccinate synthase